MQDSVLNLCRVKLRDQQRLDRARLPRGVPAVPARQVHRRRAARRQRRRRRPAGLGAQVQGLGDRPQRLHLLHRSRAMPGSRSATRIGKPEWKTDPAYTTAKARQPHIIDIFATIEDWLDGQDQVRGRRHPAQVRHPVLAGAVDEGDSPTIRRCARAAPSSRSTTRCAAST